MQSTTSFLSVKRCGHRSNDVQIILGAPHDGRPRRRRRSSGSKIDQRRPQTCTGGSEAIHGSRYSSSEAIHRLFSDALGPCHDQCRASHNDAHLMISDWILRSAAWGHDREDGFGALLTGIIVFLVSSGCDCASPLERDEESGRQAGLFVWPSFSRIPCP